MQQHSSLHSLSHQGVLIVHPSSACRCGCRPGSFSLLQGFTRSPSSPHHLLSCLRLVALKTHYFSSSLNQGFRLFSLRRSEAGLPGIYLNTKKFRNQIMLFNRGSGIHHSPVASLTHSLLPLAPGFQSHQDETPPQCREDRGCNKDKILLPWAGFGGPPLQWWASMTEESSD